MQRASRTVLTKAEKGLHEHSERAVWGHYQKDRLRKLFGYAQQDFESMSAILIGNIPLPPMVVP
jgi:hypothetical protein